MSSKAIDVIEAAFGVGEVHLRLVDLDRPHWMSHGLLEALGADETAQAGRFRSTLHRDRFMAGRCYVRLVLSRHLGIGPARVVLRLGEYGKPFLDQDDQLSFNLAHCENVALLGLTRLPAVGVDLELVRPLADRAGVQRTVFAKREIVELGTLPSSRQLDAFFAAWVCKEAVVKLMGAGLAQDLRAFEVEVDPDTPARITRSGVPGISHKDVELWRVPILDGCRAACAVFRDGTAATVRVVDDRDPQDGD